MVKKKLLPTDRLKSTIVSTSGLIKKSYKSPDEQLGDLFLDVQNQQIYADGKTFVDLVPKKRVKAIQDEYRIVKKDPHFDLHEFITRHFYDLGETIHKKAPLTSDQNDSPARHIEKLWTHLERRNRLNRGSLLALPYKYIVPGGRFNEQFYWDTFFIMLGLEAEGKWVEIEGMIKNYAYLIRKYGFIPTANRTYFISRSQPPFFSQMVLMLARHKGSSILLEYLPYMIAEYRFWMKGRAKLAKAEHRAFLRVVEMPNGKLMNRYYDNKATPRPESMREDTETATLSNDRIPDRLFLHLRAAAESGWDFSSRWLTDPDDLRTIHTADIVPIDLNCLLHMLEMTIADTYRIMRQPLLVRKFEALAERRKKAIDEYCWDEASGFYRDYNFHHQAQTTSLTLAGVFPLYAGIASEAQAEKVAKVIEQDFLKEGGLVTTLIENGQQWDSPNGWAPLQWVAVQGLRRYGYDELADKIKDRWLALNEKVFNASHKMVEKYNVVGGSGFGGGGEYSLQDGFGWTNGVYQAFRNDLSK